MWKKYRKKVSTLMFYIEDFTDMLEARRTMESIIDLVGYNSFTRKFEIQTQSNLVIVKPPFYLAIDKEGFPYPVSIENHKSSYEEVNE